jgi:hypothetical protein
MVRNSVCITKLWRGAAFLGRTPKMVGADDIGTTRHALGPSHRCKQRLPGNDRAEDMAICRCGHWRGNLGAP